MIWKLKIEFYFCRFEWKLVVVWFQFSEMNEYCFFIDEWKSD